MNTVVTILQKIFNICNPIKTNKNSNHKTYKVKKEYQYKNVLLIEVTKEQNTKCNSTGQKAKTLFSKKTLLGLAKK